MNLHAQLRQIARFGSLARYIDQHLDDELDLARLADIACMTRHRLDSAFHGYAHETPMSRVWRLRLLRAGQQIAMQPWRPLLDVALDAGYGSAPAFTRAFRRLHGQPPSSFRHRFPVLQPGLRIEILPELAIQHLPYAGPRSELQHASNELRARAMRTDIERDRRFGWMVDVESNLYAVHEQTRIELQAALLHAPIEQGIPGLDRATLAGGVHAVFRFHAGAVLPARSVLLARIAAETGWHATDGPWLRRCRNLQHLPSFLDRRFEIYIPVRPNGPDAIVPQAFVLER